MSLTTPPMANAEPIPGYRLCERIGAGGYGEVWRCEASGGLFKAIKLVYGRLDDERAARELKAMMRIKGVRHPLLISLERIEVVDGQLMIVTELADGSLKDRFEFFTKQKLPGIPIDELLNHLRDAADALDYMSEAHSLQHLDVKPENLLTLGGRVKVADFGLVKEIQDVTASIMGGLTPIYAPPEVFDGQPTKYSDQYSLAIVFQEMLTGVLPFPGRTAAQLAAQHLNAKPRMQALPPIYQPVVGRALSKTPTERFVNCREMVDALLAVRMQQKFGTPPASQHPTQSAASPQVPTRPFDSSEDASSVRTPDAMLADLNEATAAANWTPEMDRCYDVDPPRPASDVPPVEFSATTWTTRPTLFIGVGGTGRRALEALKQRWQDHFIGSGPAMKVLGLDTDVQPTGSFAVDETALLRHDETLELPLRKPQDYRRDGAKFQGWLSRRWLFNIPRSQQTEGIRPLGRLALADHSVRVQEAFTAALKDLMIQDESRATRTSCGMTTMPRVVLVGGIGGGTGGGMMVDLCYMIRQVLEEMKLHSSELIVVMTHSTPRNPSAQEVAAASAYSTLCEFAHYSREGIGYAGDTSCGIKSFTGKGKPYEAAYLIHLGNELSQFQYDRGIDRIGEFLFLESATPAGGYFAACRRNDAGAEDGMTVRTIGLCQLGFSQDLLLSELTDELCRETISRWIGCPKPNVRSTSSTSVSASVLANRNSLPQTPVKQEEIDQLADQLVASLQIDATSLSNQIRSMIEADVGQPCDTLVHTLATPDNSVGEADLLPRIQKLFGARDEQGELPEARQAVVRQAIEAGIRNLVTPMGERLRNELTALVESPLARVFGAARAVRRVQSNLKSLIESTRSTRSQLTQELAHLTPWMHPIDARQRNKTTPAEIATRRKRYCAAVIEDTITASCQHVVATLQSFVTQANDMTVDLDRELKGWQDQFRDFDSAQFISPTESNEEDRKTCDRAPLDPLRAIVSSELQQRIPSLAAAIDQQISQSFLSKNGGLRNTILAGGPLRQDLAKILQEMARRGMLRLLQSIDIPTLLSENISLTNGGGSGPNPLLDAALKSAEPVLANCGGNRRLISIPPPSHDGNWPADRVAQWLSGRGFAHKPAILRNCGSDAVLMYEVGSVSLRLAAAQIIDSRPDLVDVARRLHTRTDINWAPLPNS